MEPFRSGNALKFVIHVGNNPVGARYAGDRGVRTKRPFEGRFYTVDGSTGGKSFKALAGFISSKLGF